MIAAGDGYVLDNPTTRVAKVNSPNERSIAVWVTGKGGFDALITGDLIGQEHGTEDAAVEAALGQALKKRGVDIEVLRNGHHGAENATELSFVQDIKPEVAIISTGDNQKPNYNHPACKTYQTLKDAKVGLVLQTELGKSACQANPAVKPVVVDGSIRIDVTGADYSITSIGSQGANKKPTATIAYACTLDGGCTPGTVPPSPLGPRPRLPDRGASGDCCKVCTTSVPCGDACIPRGRTCSKPPGCACAGSQ